MWKYAFVGGSAGGPPPPKLENLKKRTQEFNGNLQFFEKFHGF